VWSHYLVGLSITAICTGIAFPVFPYFDPVNIVMVYLLGATLSGLLLSRGASALTAVTSTVAFDFFFVPPRFTFYVAETQYFFTMGVMLGVALVISNLMVNLRIRTELLAERERRTETLYAMSRDLAAAADSADIATVAVRHVGAALGAAAAVLIPNTAGRLIAGGNSSVTVPNFDPGTAHWVFANCRPPEKSALAPALLYLPLLGSTEARGVLVVAEQEGTPPQPEKDALLEALAGQIALALERARLAEQAAAAYAAAERTTLRNTLLASISHDLRGPLAAIAGAGSLVAQSNGSLDRQRRQSLGILIEEKARDMSGLLMNVLELMRLETTSGPPRADWQSLEELIAIAVRNNEHRLSRWNFMSRVPADFPLLRVDAQLIVQLLSNLLENTTKYTPPGTSIELRACLKGGNAVIVLEDDGPGFGERNPEVLFEKFERGRPEGHVSGVGLGLAICRAVVRLHGGEIHAANGVQGGARFEVILPVDAAQQPAGRAA
jgi:two-component system sensor histidine kinase KdpD